MRPLKKELKIRLNAAKKVAIIGIGSILKGDDGVGVAVIEALRRSSRQIKSSLPVKLFSCGTAPENFTGEIKRFKPSHILIVDAFDMGEAAGSIRIIDDERDPSANVSFSTHALPMRVFIDYLRRCLHCQSIFLGVQVKQVEFAAPLSYEANKAVARISRLITEAVIN